MRSCSSPFSYSPHPNTFVRPSFVNAITVKASWSPPGISMNQIYRTAMPYVWFGLTILILVMMFPGLATWLPRLLG